MTLETSWLAFNKLPRLELPRSTYWIPIFPQSETLHTTENSCTATRGPPHTTRTSHRSDHNGILPIADPRNPRRPICPSAKLSHTSASRATLVAIHRCTIPMSRIPWSATVRTSPPLTLHPSNPHHLPAYLCTNTPTYIFPSHAPSHAPTWPSPPARGPNRSLPPQPMNRHLPNFTPSFFDKCCWNWRGFPQTMWYYGVDTCDGPSDFGASWYRVVTVWLISHVRGGRPDTCVGGGGGGGDT